VKNKTNVEDSIFRKKGFFIALYSCLGAVAVLAFVVTFVTNNQSNYDPQAYEQEDLLQVAADQVDGYLANVDPEAWFRPRQTPAPTPPPQETQPQRPTGPPEDNQTMPEISPPPSPAPTPEAEAPAEPDPVRVETFEPFTGDDSLAWPVNGEVIMPFSLTALIFDPTLDQFRTNDNLLISAEEGDQVHAGADGRVVSVGRNVVRGNYVVIDHGDGLLVTYGQLQDDAIVSVGQIVRTNQVIGNVGLPSIFGYENGTHVHMHVTWDEELVDPYELLMARDSYE